MLYNCSIVTMIKDEIPEHLKEWLEWNLFVGFEHFYICDDHSEIPVNETLKAYSQYITFMELPDGLTQKMQYFHENLFIKNHLHDSKWCFFIDADEFLVVKQDTNIKDFLDNYSDCGGLAVNWMMFGTSGHVNRPQGLIIENYTRAYKHAEIKCIIQSKHLKSMAYGPCEPILHEGFTMVDENKNPIGLTMALRNDKWMINEPKLQLNHYYTKSVEDWMLRRKRTTGGLHACGEVPWHHIFDRYKEVDQYCNIDSLEAKNKIYQFEEFRKNIKLDL